jgi:hypothetical protein
MMEEMEMKRTLLAVFTVASMLLALSIETLGFHEREGQRTRATTITTDNDDRDDLPEKEEFRQTYQLSPGARVEVSGINGTAEIETWPGSTAEVTIVRSARSREDLEFHKVIVEQTGNTLTVRSERDRQRSVLGRNRQVRQRVMLKLPRQVELAVSGINGRVTVGEIDGPVKLSGINGRVEVAQARGYSDITGINGRVKITISQLGEQGIHVSGVNGGVELMFAEEVNADLDVTGINGSVNTDVSNVTVLGKIDRQNFHATIGSGGSPIRVSGVNGHVKLSRAGSPG